MAAADPPTGTEPFDRRVIVVGAVVFAVLMALSTRYGFQRDELYFLDSARHLQGSYVDQPVLVPLLARVSLSLFGLSLTGLRVWSALAAWATVLMCGLTARELGGRRRAQLLAALAAATMPALLAADHVLETTTFDILAWSALAFVVIRIGRTGNYRWWLLGGVILGLGLANKHLVGFFAVAMFIGALLSRGHRTVLNWWFLAGATIAAAFTVPDLWWQAQHHWATIAMTQALNGENGGPGEIPGWVVGQLIMASLATVWIWVAGLRFLWRSGRPLCRALVWAYGLLFVVFAVTTGGQIYYLAGAYVYLLAAGAVSVDGWLHAKRRRVPILAVATTVATALILPIVLPVLPAADAEWTYAVNQDGGEQIGWPEFVNTVQSVWVSLPPEQRANAVIFTGNYSQASAINELGRKVGLPGAISGQNSEWWWGPGTQDATTVVVVAAPDVTAADVGRYFTGVRMAATVTNPYGIHNDEYGDHVFVCTGLRQSWPQLWPQLRHYD
ncbi:MAG TPA: glycosyltransferase family 39 protein [Rugosimonospora sp.]